MDITTFNSGITQNITSAVSPKSIPATVVGQAFTDLATLTKTNVEAINAVVTGHTTQINSLSGITTSNFNILSGVTTGNTFNINSLSGLTSGHTAQITSLTSTLDTRTLVFSNSPIPTNALNLTAVTPTFSYSIASTGNISVSGVTSKNWDAVTLDIDPTANLTFLGGHANMWLVLGYQNSNNICALGIYTPTCFGRVVNVNLSANTFTTINGSIQPTVASSKRVNVQIVGGVLNLYADGVLTYSATTASLITSGASLQNLKYGVAPFNSAGTSVANGSVLVSGLSIPQSSNIVTSFQSLAATVSGITFENNIKGKNIAIIGDSISTAGVITGVDSNTIWWGRLRDTYAVNVLVNGISGSGIGSLSPAADPQLPFVTDSRWQSLNSGFTPDIILIFGGTNDFGYLHVPLGAVTDADTLKTTFYGALKYLYKSMITRYPNAKIFHMLPLHRGDSSIPEVSVSTGLAFADYITAIKTISELYGVGVINTRNDTGFTPYNMNTVAFCNSPSGVPDGVHPIAAKHSNITDIVFNSLNKVYRS